jgi:hypothetical protein
VLVLVAPQRTWREFFFGKAESSEEEEGLLDADEKTEVCI